MKKRIIAVFLSAVLGFGAFTASVPVVASAASASLIFEGIELVLTIKEFIDFVADGLGICSASLESQHLNQMEFNERISARYIASVRALFETQNNGDLNPSLVDAFLNDIRDNKDLSYINSAYGFNLSQADVDMLRGDYNHVKNHYELSDADTVGFAIDGWYWYDDHCDIDDNGNVQVPVEDLKQELEKQNQTITPKNRNMHKYSWRELSNTQKDYSAFFLCRVLGNNGKFLENTFEQGIYIQPYYRLNSNLPTSNDSIPPTGGDYYYPYQIHLYRETTTGESLEGSSGERYPNNTYTWYAEFLHYMFVGEDRLDSYKQTLCSSSSKIDSSGVYQSNEVRYINFGFGYSGKEFFFDTYKTLPDAFSTPNINAVNDVIVPPNSVSDCSALFKELNSTYLLSTNVNVKFENSAYFRGYFSDGVYGRYYTSVTRTTLDEFNALQAEKGYSDKVSDYGFYVSVEPFSTTYLFDVTKLPTNATVTISGDSVYDYSITDNSTGETSTIYNYVTNNYTYPENSGGNGNQGGGSGGSVGGKIEVDGKVDVGGKVDINVNVNGGGNGVNGNIGDYVGDNSDINTDINDYLELVPKVSKSFMDYMKDLFGWLPEEVRGLLVLCLILCVVRLVLALRGR